VALEISQDRLVEKTFIERFGIPTAISPSSTRPGDWKDALAKLGGVVLKTRRSAMTARASARIAMPGRSCRRLRRDGRRAADPRRLHPFEREISVIAARAIDGDGRRLRRRPRTSTATASCKTSTVPRTSAIRRRLPANMRRSARALDYVGVLGHRVLRDGRTAAGRQRDRPARPQFRPLDRGRLRHSQFEQHIRAVVGCRW
jgi:5-(carboxyamino)imidazole ribonucleotide synthase